MSIPNPPAIVSEVATQPATETIYKWAQTAAVALLLVLVSEIRDLTAAPYMPFALAGAFVIHMTMTPSRRDLLAVLASALAFAAVYFLHHGAMLTYLGNTIGVPGEFLGLGTLLVLGWQWIWAPARTKWSHFERVREAGLIPLLCLTSMITVIQAAALTPVTYDRVLYAFDLKFGGPPSWVIGRMFREHPWLHTMGGTVYNSLPLALAVCMAIQWQDRQKKVRLTADLRWVAMALGSVGFVLYQICPVAGPVYMFGNQFPLQVPDLTAVAIAPAWLAAVPRNGMPSLHVGWALLLFWNMRRNVWWIRIGTGVYLALTAATTLGSGEHYLADLMVAPAVALINQAACTGTRLRDRWLAIGTGGAIAIAWLIAFRTGAALAIPGGVATWSLAVLSMAIPAAVAWRLDWVVAEERSQ